MPYGVTWNFYIKTLASNFAAMLAGNQLVHMWYSPDLSIPEIPPKKGELHTRLYTRNIFFRENEELPKE